jgi:ATP synthase protein I
MRDEYRAMGSWGTLGLEIVLSVGIGFFGGRWIDGRFGTTPWISVLGFFFGCGAAAKAIHRTWVEMQKVTAREERLEGNPAPRYERPQDRGGSKDAPPSPTSLPEEHDDRAP